MASLTLRLQKGQPLTHQELDDNFIALNIDKWKYDTYGYGQIVYYTHSDNITRVYFCVKGHSKVIYQNKKFTTKSNAITYWKEIANTSGNENFINVTGDTATGIIEYSQDFSNQFTQRSLVDKQFVDDAISGLNQSGTTIGSAEDGTYDDGLFTDFSNSTKVGVAVDRFNEVLLNLTPSPAPSLDYNEKNLNGVNGYLTFDSNNTINNYSNVNGIGSLGSVNIDQQFSISTHRVGIIDSNTDITTTLNEDVPEGDGTPNSAYPENAFGDADQGELKLELNGSILTNKTIDLSNAGSVNQSGSGFNISDNEAVQFPNGNDFDLFQYRTGTVTVSSNDMTFGWNYVRIIHTINNTDTVTNYIDWVVDGNTDTTTYSNESLHSLSMTGSKHLSGVEYFTDGSALYNIDIDNVYKNTYIKSNAITHPSTNCSLNSENLPDSNGNENQTYNIVDKNVNINNNIRLINDNIQAKTNAKRTVQSNLTSNGSSISGILMDDVSSNSTQDSLEDFNDESYRLKSNLTFDNDLNSNWDSSLSIEDNINSGYGNGLQVTEGKIIYPTTDYSSINNGPSNNVDYSTNITGIRYYYRFWYDPNIGTAKFRINLNGSGTFISESQSFTNNSDEIKMSIKLPTETGWMDTYEDFSSGNHNDGDGCRDTSGGNSGRAFNTDWDLNVGTKNTANSFYKVYIRITVPENWTGEITQMNWTFR